MSLVKCVFSREGKNCTFDFSEDGHDMCVRHRPCVSSDFVFDPWACRVCEENVKFLKSVGRVDTLSHQYVSLKQSWAAVRRSARRKEQTATWKDTALQEFIVGLSCSRASSRGTSSSLSSPALSSHEGQRAGPSSAPGVSPTSPATPVHAPPPTEPLPEGGVTPQLRDLIQGLFREFAASLRPVSDAPPVGPSPVPQPAVADPPALSSQLPGPSGVAFTSSTPYEAEASPISDDDEEPEFDDEDSTSEAEHLPSTWVPVPQEWSVLQDGDSWSLARPDPSSGCLSKVPDLEVCWGVSHHSPTPAWHFRSIQAPAPSSTLPAVPRPSFEDLHRSLSTLGFLAGLSPPVVTESDEHHSFRSLGLSWTAGRSGPFLRHLQDWWTQAVAKANPGQPSPPQHRQRIPILPQGPSWDASIGTHLNTPLPRSFTPPLLAPKQEVLRSADRARTSALEMFSGFSSLLAVEHLLNTLAQKKDLPSLSPSVLCQYLLPVLHNALWQLAPSLSGEVGRYLSEALSIWKTATASLPATAQSALLTADPFSPDFGSATAVSEAVARAPQVAVVYRGRGPSRPPRPRGKKVFSSSQRPARPSSHQPRPHGDARYHPYQPRSSRSHQPQVREERTSRAPPYSSSHQVRRPFRPSFHKGGRR